MKGCSTSGCTSMAINDDPARRLCDVCWREEKICGLCDAISAALDSFDTNVAYYYSVEDSINGLKKILLESASVATLGVLRRRQMDEHQKRRYRVSTGSGAIPDVFYSNLVDAIRYKDALIDAGHDNVHIDEVRK